MKRLYTLFIILALSTNFWHTAAMSNGLKWLTLRDGLAGISVTCFAEDPSGKMWIGTTNGVTLYNGLSMKTYSIPRIDGGQPNFCFELKLDDEGNVWAATRGGVYVLKRWKNDFERIAPEITGAEAIVCVDKSIYVGCREGLFHIDTKSRKTHAIDVSSGHQRGNNSVRCIRRWGDELWISMRTGLVRMNLSTQKTSFVPFETPSGLSRFDICQGKLYIGTKNNGLFCMNPRTGQTTQVSEVSNVINNVQTTPDGKAICVATDGSGAWLLSGATAKPLLHYDSQSDELNNTTPQLPSNALYSFMQTSKGSHWIGMFQNGLAHTDVNYGIFTTYNIPAFSSQGKNITCSLSDGNTRILSTNNGFWVVNETTGKADYHDVSKWRMMNINQLFSHEGNIYIGSNDDGLLCYNKQSGTISRIPNCPQLEYATINDMTHDNKGRLWVASSEGLFVISNNTVLRNYTEKNSRLPMGTVSIRFDQQGKGWIGAANGLCLYLPQEDDFKTSGFPQGLFNGDKRLYFQVKGNTIYARSHTKVYWTDDQMKQFGELDIPDNILAENCRAYIPPTNGLSFIVTERGLFRIDDKNKTQLSLAESSGMRGHMLSSHAIGYDNKYLWIGTSDGLMIAPLDKLNSNVLSNKSNPMEIDYLFEGERHLTLGETMRINDQHALHIGWNFGTRKLVITPVLADFAQHSNEILEYSIDGKEWKTCQYGTAIEFRHIMLGHHILKFRMSGVPGTTTKYDIYVYPNTAFYTELAILLLALILFVWWYRWRKATKRLLVEHSATEQALIEEIAHKENIVRLSESIDRQTTKKEKYQTTRINDDEMAQLFKMVDKYVKEQKPYLNKDSKMSDIASALGVSPSTMSQMFTLYVKEPYYDYINQYRLDMFKQLIAEGKHKQYTITALFEQCGFKKTSFFSTFRKVEGMTPTEYIEKHK